jgi:hypothetical protein
MPSAAPTKRRPARPPAADPLDTLLRRLIRAAPDAKTRNWLRRMLRSGERTGGAAGK